MSVVRLSLVPMTTLPDRPDTALLVIDDDSEPLVHKKYGDSFESTDLEPLLAERGVGRLIVMGAQTDACIRSTIHGAFTRGYET
jgi:nicotinamidase-related amidase